MDISVLFKIAAVGLIVALLNQLLTKTDRGEYAMLVTVAGLIVVILVLLGRDRKSTRLNSSHPK